MEMESVLFLCFSAFLYFSSEDFRKKCSVLYEALTNKCSFDVIRDS